jgi:hypothetical protein
VAGVKNIEAAIGNDQNPAAGTHAVAPGAEVIAGEDFPEAIHGGR